MNPLEIALGYGFDRMGGQQPIVTYTNPFERLGSPIYRYLIEPEEQLKLGEDKVLALRLIERAHTNYWSLSSHHRETDTELSKSYWLCTYYTDELVRFIRRSDIRVDFGVYGRRWNVTSETERETVFSLEFPHGSWKRRYYRVLDRRHNRYGTCYTARYIERWLPIQPECELQTKTPRIFL